MYVRTGPLRVAAVLTDRLPPQSLTPQGVDHPLRGRREISGQPGEVNVHQVGKLAHLGKPG
jgi:hypothetical protein